MQCLRANQLRACSQCREATAAPHSIAEYARSAVRSTTACFWRVRSGCGSTAVHERALMPRSKQ